MRKRARTREEYEAAAMLLGRRYDAGTHTFYQNHFFQGADLDADTLEELTTNELARRMIEGYREESGRIEDENT